MSKTPTFEEFKSSIDKFDNYFVRFSKSMNKLNNDEGSEISKAENDQNNYLDNLIKERVGIFLNLKNNVQKIIGGFSSRNVDLNSFGIYCKEEHFDSIDNAIKTLNERNETLKTKLAELNEFNFESSTATFSFDGEKATINNKEYVAPNFPELTDKDFDTDKNYLPLIKDIYSACLDVLSNIDFIVNYYNGKAFKEKLSAIKGKVSDQFTDEISSSFDESKRKLISSCETFFKNECGPYLEQNNLNLNDFQTVDTLNIPVDFRRKINIGSTPYQFKNFDMYANAIEKINYENLVKKDINVPYYIDLTKKGNILINTNGSDENLNNFIHQLIMQFVSSVPYKKINLALVDVDDSDDFDFVFDFSKEYLKNNKLLFNGNIATDEESFKEMVVSLNRKINEVKGDKLGPKYCNNVFEYNDMSPENTQELYLMVYVNCPKCLDSSLSDKISSLILNGNMCGVYSIILNNTKTPLAKESYQYNSDAHKEFISKISNSSTVIDYDVKTKMYHIKDIILNPNYSFKTADVNQFFKLMNEGCAKEGTSKIIYLDSILNNTYEKKNYFDQIKIPVGKDGGELVYFELDIEGTGTSSAIVAGVNGSGKSSFLHTIILSGASYYSPDELEYYLIDFKDGVEFGSYLNKTNGKAIIPHVTFLSLKNKVEDAYDILEKIYLEKEYRNKCFGKVNAQNLISYQKHPDVISGKLPSFKRTVVIIDEYQNFLPSTNTSTMILCNKCAGKLLSLLKEIRNVGISLILSSQGIDIERDALEQINNRYIMRSSASTLQTAFPNFSGDTMNIELNKEKGLVYKTQNGGDSKQLFKAAYCGKLDEEKAQKIIAEINKKYPSANNDIIISGNPDTLSVVEANAPFVKNTSIDVDEKNSIFACFGQSALSNQNISLVFNDEDFCNYILIGDLKKTRSIEASIGLSFLYCLKQFNYEISKECLFYLDLNYSSDALRNPSPFDTYKDNFADLMTYSVEVQDIIDSINRVYEIFKQRKELSRQRSRDIKTPILVLVNSYSCLGEIKEETNGAGGSMSVMDDLNSLSEMGFGDTGNDSEISLIDKIKTIYENGHTYNIFMVIQDKRSAYLNKFDNFADYSRVICCDSRELENCLMSENGSSVIINDLPSNYVVMFPQVSKIRPFIFDGKEKEMINKFCKEISK